MSSANLFRQAEKLFWIVTGFVRPLAPLLTRLVIGHAFVQTGVGKWQNFSDTVDFFRSIGLPAPAANAAFIASLEVVGGAALILGLGTHLFSALLSSTMVVALLTADRESFVGAITGSSDKTLTDVLPIVFLMPLVWLIAFGAGPLSVDDLFSRRRSDGTAFVKRAAA
jgi:putative oxidoreductase